MKWNSYQTRVVLTLIIVLGVAFFWVPEERNTGLVTGPIKNAGFEEGFDSKGVPAEWQLTVQSGSYLCRVVKRETLRKEIPPNPDVLGTVYAAAIDRRQRNVYAGECSLELAGTGGSASLLSKPVEIQRPSLVECTAQVKRQFEKAAACSLDVDVEGDCNGESVLPPQAVSERDRQWQKLSVVKKIDCLATARVVLKLEGEALVHVDDVSMRVFERSEVISDCGFEEFAAGKRSLPWKIASHTNKNDVEAINDDPKQGKACIRLKGADDWKVIYSNRFPSTKRQLILRADVRVALGKGSVKIEYFGSSPQKVQTFQVAKTNGWNRIELRSKPEYLNSSQSFLVTLVASPEDNEHSGYSVDFDDVELFVER